MQLILFSKITVLKKRFLGLKHWNDLKGMWILKPNFALKYDFLLLKAIKLEIEKQIKVHVTLQWLPPPTTMGWKGKFSALSE